MQQTHQYSKSMLSTWETLCTVIAQQCPIVVRLLSFFAFLDLDDIFLELFCPEVDSPTAQSGQ